MRLKTFFNFNFKQSALIVWQRVTLSRLTIFYFVFSLAHAIVQVLFQGQAFQINQSAAKLIHSIIIAANVSLAGVPILDANDLKWCKSFEPGSCTVVWSSDGAKIAIPDSAYKTSSESSEIIASVSTTGVHVAATTSSLLATSTGSAVNSVPTRAKIKNDDDDDDDDDNDDDQVEEMNHGERKRSPPIGFLPPDANPTTESSKALDDFEFHTKRHPITILVADKSQNDTSVTLLGLPNAPANLTLDKRCLLALTWPLETLHNTKREDIVFITFHLWVLGMSVVALLNESIPHMIASLLTHVIVTSWSSFQLVQTRNFLTNFQKIVTNGSCDGENLLPTYWSDRANAEIPSAVLNGVALIISAFLTYRLVKTYNWATFKRIGANRHISSVYKVVLSLSVTLQLSLFFIVAAMALWIDQICFGVISTLVIHMVLYRGVYISVLILLVPWIVVGWKAVRLEHRQLMAGFLIFNVALFGGWGAMFSSNTFRFTFEQWQFFLLMWIAALVLMVLTFVLGVMCRRNFGSDLNKFLNASKIEDEEDFESASYPGDAESGYGYADDKRSLRSEKVDYPSPGPVPTFGQISRTASNSSTSTTNTSYTNASPVSIATPNAAHLPPRYSDTSVSVIGSNSGVIVPGGGGAPLVSRFSDTDSQPSSRRELERNISVGSAHSASSMDGARRTGGGRTKKWVIE